jgi:hypothetical protein
MQENNTFTGQDRRGPERTDELVRAVVVAVRAEVASQIMPEEIHREHHAFMTEWIAAEKRRQDRLEKIKTQVGGWAIISILSTIGTLAYQGFLWAKEHYK